MKQTANRSIPSTRQKHFTMLFVALGLLLSQVTWGQSATEPRVVTIEYRLGGKTIDDVGFLNNLRRKTTFSAGEPFSRYQISRSIKAIYSSGEFAQIEVTQSDVPGGVALTFHLTRKITIRQVSFNGARLDRSRLLEAIKSRPGKEYNAQIAEADRQKLLNFYKDFGYFQAEVVLKPPTTLPSVREVEVSYQVTEGEQATIRDIEPKEVRKVLKVKTGQAYEKRLLEDELIRLRAEYREKGYLTVQIQYNLTYHDISNEVSLNFTLTKGGKVNVVFEGEGIDKEELRKRLSLFKQDSYSQQILDSNKRQIERFYLQKGYYNPEVTYQLKSEPKGEVTIQFQINLGVAPRIAQIDFEGNTAFDDSALLALMKTKTRSRWATIPGLGWLFSKGIFDPKILDSDIRALGIAYRKAGYPTVQLNYEQEMKDEQLYLNIKIKEGKLLFRIDMVHQKDLDALRLSAGLRQEFQNRGPIPLSQNIDVTIQKPDSSWRVTDVGEDKIYTVWKEADKLNVYERERQVISQVLIQGAQLFNTAELQAKLDAQAGEPYSKDVATSDSTHLRFLYEEQGYAYATINPNYDVGTGELTYQITEGEPALFGRFYFHGNLGVKLYVLEREFKPLEGQLFQSNKLEEAKQRLLTLGIFQRVETKTPGRLNGNRIIDVDVHVDVRKPRSVSISGGFSPSEGIRGTIGLAHNNLYKRNLRAGGKLRIGTRGKLYELTLIEPWFIGRTIGTFRLFEDNLEEHDDTRARGVTTSLAKRLGAFSNFGVQYKYQELRQRLDESTEEFTTVSSVGVSFHRDNRDSFLDPKQGWLNEFGAEYAGGFIRGRTSFFKFTADNRVYQPIPKLLFARNMVFASSLRLGFAQGLRSNRERSIASFERFWAGGSTTVRGYKERSLGPVDAFRNRRGNVMFIFNTELRFPIYNIVGGVVFFDAGNVWDKPAEITKVAPLLESAVGVGVRVFTPLGPARIDYGFPLVKGRSPEFYVELGHAF